MKEILIFFAALYFIATALLLGYDAMTALIERYSHFHMGRWPDVPSWKAAVRKVCARWAVRTPTLRIKNGCRYLLLDRIRGTYGKAMVQSWQKAGCILGLQEDGDQQITAACKARLIDETGSWQITVDKIDYAMLAYALLRQEQQPQTIRPAMDHMLRCIENNLCPDGMVSYSAGKNSKRRYVDTLGFICPFLGLYARIYNEPRYAHLALEQLRLFRERGLMDDLPVHCYHAENGLPLGIYGWGRGIGWYTLGLIDLYPELPEGGEKQLLRSWLGQIAEACLPYEREDGGFSSILHAGHIYDSSATAMLGYFYARCGQYLDRVEYTRIALRCRKRLIRVTKITGVVDECQGDTIDLGIFSQRYAPMPFAQGMALRLSAVLDKSKEAYDAAKNQD